MTRRNLLGGLSAMAAMPAVGAGAGLPRKVIVGTIMQGFWVKHPGVKARVEELAGAVEEMKVEAVRKYGRGLDLAILPETSISGEADGDAWERAVAWDGVVGDSFARLAQVQKSYIVVATYLREEGRRCSNAAVLVGRTGRVEGIYRKVHLVPSAGGGFEGGSAPGKEFPVFDCDFGKLGIQICYDMEFDAGWKELKRKGAELVAWPTQSPQRAHPCARAMEQRCYIVSSTWRNNASVFEPTGKIVAGIEAPARVLVQEIDLSYLILPWSGKLRNGRALRDKYGERVGYRYYEDEDLGMFWSNDAKVGIGEMAGALGLVEADKELERVRRLYGKAGMAGY
ncbi:MAG: carbon-nitrogen hydrolase family protein [Bryobacterales bacterium]|nr:carbon-nitrogen hydrolase family protein [Bryobacterales bacterium]